jgi:serine/threonine protein phosphatase PrpC
MSQGIFDETQAETKIAIAYLTDTGMVRKSNQDSFIIADLNNEKQLNPSGDLPPSSIGANGWLLAVADGMGGAQAGDIASRMATEQIASRLTADSNDQPVASRLRNSIKTANREIWELAGSRMEYKGMGTTLTAAIIQNGRAIIGQVGDSRGYLIRKGHIHQITKDQSLVQALIDAGQMTEEDAGKFAYRNIILHALGVEQEVEPEIGAVVLKRGDYLLICCDGLSNKVGNVEIHDIVLQSETLNKACERLVNLANERGGEDNITVILAQVDGASLPEPSPDTGKLVPVEHL